MGDAALEVFCRQVRNRSRENKEAFSLVHHGALTGSAMAILRQELDSMVRCIFLLSISDREYRKRLLVDSINGKPWRTEDGRSKITDRNMVDLSSKLHGWARNVYAFGCGFIHLSAFHDYPDRDPFDLLTSKERKDIAGYLRHYHGFELVASTTFREIEPILPAVFEKISGNLECYIRDLEADCNLADA